MVSNSILVLFSVGLLSFFITVHTKVCVLKATIVANAFLVQYLSNQKHPRCKKGAAKN